MTLWCETDKVKDRLQGMDQGRSGEENGRGVGKEGGGRETELREGGGGRRGADKVQWRWKTSHNRLAKEACGNGAKNAMNITLLILVARQVFQFLP